jgi:cytoskeletal protein CcmA (bactofilin family)
MSESVETYKRVVVDGQWDGDVIPGRPEELLRQVTVRPGAHVSGGVFGHSVRIEGPADIGGAVYATKDVELVPTGLIRIRSSVGAREIVAVQPAQGRVLVEGDVVARHVALRHALVRGSVHGDEARLESSIVFGPVSVTSLAHLHASTVLTVSASVITFASGCVLILPYARAETKIEIEAPVGVAGFGEGENLLTASDVIARAGRHHLTAGRRMTDLGQIAGRLDDVNQFMRRLVMGQALPAASGSTEVDLAHVPSVFAPAVELEVGAR